MAIIRSGRESVEGVIAADALAEQQLAEEAKRALAEGDAEKILAAARQEAERVLKTAAHEGRERGLAAVTELLVGARLVAERARQSADQELRVLAVKIAEKILGRELQSHPDVVVDVAREALRHASSGRDLVIRVHPDDLAFIERGKPRLVERCRSARSVDLRADGSVPRGGCIIESELGVVDARLAVQLEAIERALRGDGG